LWFTVVAVVVTLALYRRVAAGNPFTVLHVRNSEVALLPEQRAVARRLDRIDCWGKILTGVAIGYGMLLVFAYIYAGIVG
jgi:hypothetical protein